MRRNAHQAGGDRTVLIGTSGWNYKSWRGPFFPKELPARRHLEFYASRFGTIELNGVFYRAPTEQSVRQWAAQTPKDFVFAWKASKYITHWRRLRDSARESLELMESRRRLLGSKAGPVLFQLPPHFEKDRERLAAFFKLLPRRRDHAFEFRHPSWYEDDILDLLRDHDIALCISDHRDAPSPWVVTARHLYVRGHGPGGQYRGRYRAAVLKTWAGRLREMARSGGRAYVYFDNDQESAAPRDAAKLASLTEDAKARRPPPGRRSKR